MELTDDQEVAIVLDVADVQLVFENSKLIELLKERGEQIKMGKNEETINEQNKIIDNYLNKNNQKGKKDLTTIIGAYVTFQTEDGFNEAIQFIKHPEYLCKKHNNICG